MTVTIPSWLEISWSKFKEKTKSYNILSNTWKVLFLVYFYDKKKVLDETW
jgi:hypothetical protein